MLSCLQIKNVKYLNLNREDFHIHNELVVHLNIPLRHSRLVFAHLMSYICMRGKFSKQVFHIWLAYIQDAGSL
jgi:hypothetical protein